MKNRAVDIVDFLAHAGWDGAEQTPLQADFSTRRFARLERADGPVPRAVLMDADPGQKTETFIKLAGLLRAHEIAAPEIYAADAARHLVLMEDFGDRNFGRMMDAGEDAKPLYRRAADLLIHLHENFAVGRRKDADLPVFDAAYFTAQAGLFLDAYFVLARERAAGAEERETFLAAWRDALNPLEGQPQTLMLRDFMPDNLMDLEGRKAWRATGLLDFQDGGIGPAAYDLASLCETVRRDGGDMLLDELIDYYCERAAPKSARQEWRSLCRLLAAQRHTRILGIIARLALDTGRRDKLACAPRIWNYLDHLLTDEKLRPVRELDGCACSACHARPNGMSDLCETAMVLAAGYGTRMRPLSLQKPKPLLEVGGRAMLDHALDKLVAAGIRRAVVNVFYLADRIETHLKGRRDLDIIISRESELLDTGGGIKNALRHFDAPFFALNADLPWMDGAVPGLQRMRESWDPSRMDASLLLMPTAKARGFEAKGDFALGADGRVWRRDLPPPRPYVWISAQILKPALFETVPDKVFSNNRVWDEAEQRGRLFGLAHDGTCYHVGTPQDLAAANGLLANGAGWRVP